MLEELGSDTHVIFPIDAPRVEAEELRAAADHEEDALLADDRSLFNARVSSQTAAEPGAPLRLAVDAGARSTSSTPTPARASLRAPPCRRPSPDVPLAVVPKPVSLDARRTARSSCGRRRRSRSARRRRETRRIAADARPDRSGSGAGLARARRTGGSGPEGYELTVTPSAVRLVARRAGRSLLRRPDDPPAARRRNSASRRYASATARASPGAARCSTSRGTSGPVTRRQAVHRPDRALQAQPPPPPPLRRPGLADRDRRRGRGSRRTAAARRSAAASGGYYTQRQYSDLVALRGRAVRRDRARDRHAGPRPRGALVVPEARRATGSRRRSTPGSTSASARSASDKPVTYDFVSDVVGELARADARGRASTSAATRRPRRSPPTTSASSRRVQQIVERVRQADDRLGGDRPRHARPLDGASSTGTRPAKTDALRRGRSRRARR